MLPETVERDPAAQTRWDGKKARVVQLALEHGLHVPQQLLDDVAPEPNPPTNFKDDGKAPFGPDEPTEGNEIPL